MGVYEQEGEKDVFTENTAGGGHGKYLTQGHIVYEKCPHTLPLAKWLQRVMMWNIGKGKEYFESLENEE